MVANLSMSFGSMLSQEREGEENGLWVREIKHGSFSPLVFSTTGGIGMTATVVYKSTRSHTAGPCSGSDADWSTHCCAQPSCTCMDPHDTTCLMGKILELGLKTYHPFILYICHIMLFRLISSFLSFNANVTHWSVHQAWEDLLKIPQLDTVVIEAYLHLNH